MVARISNEHKAEQNFMDVFAGIVIGSQVNNQTGKKKDLSL